MSVGMPERNAKVVEPLESRVHALEEGVERIEEDVRGIRSDIKALATSMAQVRQTDWGKWIAAIGLVGGFLLVQSQLITTPMAESIARNSQYVRDNEDRQDSMAVKVAEEGVHRLYSRRDIDRLVEDTKSLTGLVLEAKNSMDAYVSQLKGTE